PRPAPGARSTPAASRPGAQARPGSAGQVSRPRGSRVGRRVSEEVREVTPVEEREDSEATEPTEETEPVHAPEPEGEGLAERGAGGGRPPRAPRPPPPAAPLPGRIRWRPTWPRCPGTRSCHARRRNGSPA